MTVPGLFCPEGACNRAGIWLYCRWSAAAARRQGGATWSQKRSWKRWLWFFSLPAATVILYKLSDDLPQIAHVIGWIIGILAPFIGGFVLAFLLYAPSRALEKLFLRRKARLWQKLARPLAIGIVYLLLLGLLTLAIYLLIPQLKSSLTSLATALPGLCRYGAAEAGGIHQAGRPAGSL